MAEQLACYLHENLKYNSFSEVCNSIIDISSGYLPFFENETKKNISMAHFVFIDHEPVMSHNYIWQFDLARLNHMLALFFLVSCTVTL